MKLNVPLIRQPKNSVDCGIAGIAMILKYHGLRIPFEKVKEKIVVDEVGTYAPQLGTYLLEKGFKVTLITLHPALFTKKDEKISKNMLIERLASLKKKAKSVQNKKILSYFIEFLRKGGNIKARIPAMDDIKKEINKGNPVGALMTSNFLKSKKPGFNFHFNIITGYDDKYVFANDPLPDHRGGKNKYLINDFFFGLYASTYADLDNGCLIKIEK